MFNEVPYAKLYRIAEYAFNTGDDEEVKKMCRIAAEKHCDDYKKVYNKTKSLYIEHFSNR